MTGRSPRLAPFALGLRLAGRGFRHRWLRATGRPGRLQAVSLEVTRRCVARCIMCNIWQTPADAPERSAAEWLEGLRDPALEDLRELDVTGGEPFLRDDLAELLFGVCRLKPVAFRRLASVAITSNGLLTEKLLADVDAVLPALERAEVGLVFALGCDAVGACHDRIRRVPGGWDRLHRTVQGLVARRGRHPSLVLGLKTTVTRHNVAELDRVAAYAETHGLFTIVSPYLVTAARYANLDREGELSLSPAQGEALARFVGSGRSARTPYTRDLLRFLAGGAMHKPCSAGFNYLFLRSTGDVWPCPLIPQSLGNIRDAALSDLVRTPEARRFRRAVGRRPECAACTEPGLARYALPWEGWHYLAAGARLGPRKFRELHRHLGLDKYR